MTHFTRRAFTLLELLIVVGVLAVLVSLLLPAVQKVRESAMRAKVRNMHKLAELELANRVSVPAPATQRSLVIVRSIDANIELTPKLSVGTVDPESIYEARFVGKLLVSQPPGQNGECELELPLPPNTISLADLSIKIGDTNSEQVGIREGKLVWYGRLEAETEFAVVYTAVGKGLFEIAVPPGAILDQFRVELRATGSDVRLVDLSLQPTNLERHGIANNYTWDYKRLLIGQPVRLDAPGIAPIDRLGELTWLGPVSVVLFGLFVGLYVHAFDLQQFDRWMLLLTLGTFASVYPLMYFAQEYVPLWGAVAIAAALVLGIIGIRSMTMLGWRHAWIGVVMPALSILTVTLAAAIWERSQGMLLTVEAIACFIGAMILLPRLRVSSAAFWILTIGTSTPTAVSAPGP